MANKDEDAARVEVAKAAAKLKRELDENHVATVELHRALARMTMIRYQAFMAAGFSDFQALQLVK